MKTQQHKATIETIINTSAIALTAYGVVQITSGHPAGYIAVCFGVGIEMLKYWGRNKGFW